MEESQRGKRGKKREEVAGGFFRVQSNRSLVGNNVPSKAVTALQHFFNLSIT